MGEVANDIINGIICRVCNQYIGPAAGYPRKCSQCKSENKEDE